MAHIHTKSNQHDITVSAWIFRRVDDETRVFVHMHRKIQKYMEVGGHIELDETPWQAIAHELKEESGYELSELDIYQPNYMPEILDDRVVHPVPTFLNTFQPMPGHYHTDICYAFRAQDLPHGKPAENESQDFKWLTLSELESEPEALPDIVETYKSLARIIELPYFHAISIELFSLDKPSVNEVAFEKVAENQLPKMIRLGNPILRKTTKRLKLKDILSTNTKSLIDKMFNRLRVDDGVGLAAPQIGKSLALAVIDIHPNEFHPDREEFRAVIINPEYKGVGRRSGKWEGCLSTGSGDGVLFGKSERYSRISAKYYDERGVIHQKQLSGLVAHVFQHETDHLNGLMCIDLVKDPSTHMMGDEYRARIVQKGK